MEITKDTLIELGFEIVHITNEESDNGYDYSFYKLEITDGICLFTDLEKSTCVKAFDIPYLMIKDVDKLKLFITTVKSCLAEN